MTDVAPQVLTTRLRLLEVAAGVFAEAGYREATIRDICARAGANIAAVNYHFGGKEELYRAVIEYAAACASPGPATGAGANGGHAEASAEEQLRLFIREFLTHILDRGRPAWLGKLMAREMIEPTEVMEVIVAGVIRPRWTMLAGIVRKLLGEGASEEQVRLATASVLGQCVMYRHAAAIIERMMPGEHGTPEDIAAKARHIAEFSLAALRGLRAAGGRGGPTAAGGDA